jgi:hypothetical protein
MTADPPIALLDPLLGRWRTSGEVLGDDGSAVVATFAGTDAYRRLGDAFVVHEADVRMPEGRMQGVEIIGPWDADAGSFRTTAYDAGGTVDHATADAGPEGWTFRAGAGTAQALLRADPDGRRLHGEWARTTDGGATWTPWMRLTLVRQD